MTIRPGQARHHSNVGALLGGFKGEVELALFAVGGFVLALSSGLSDRDYLRLSWFPSQFSPSAELLLDAFVFLESPVCHGGSKIVFLIYLNLRVLGGGHIDQNDGGRR